MDSAELLVLWYLYDKNVVVVNSSHHIQTICCSFWKASNIYHSPVTYHRAWQRLLQHGRVKVVREWRERGAKVVQIKPITAKDINGFQPIPHGGK